MAKITDFSAIHAIVKLVLIFSLLSVPALSLAGSKIGAGKPVPTALTGTWQVTKVNIDTGATRTLQVKHNDPAEKGRLFVITPAKITYDGLDDMVCIHPTVTVKRTTAASLIRESMGWRGFGPEIPTPQDYELPITGNAAVDVLWLNCGKGDFGPYTKDISDNTWIVLLPDRRIAMRWFDESILILERLPANAKPTASFDCAKAKTPVENTICGSVSLASFDRSVSESYIQNIKGFTDGKDFSAVKRVKACQRAWIRKRNACGTDVNCLKKSMEEQLDVLGDLEKFYNP